MKKNSIQKLLSNKIFLSLIFVGFSVSFFGHANPAQAAQSIPYKINFQGRLTTNTGTAVTNGSYNVKFSIFSAATGGTQLWQESRQTTSRVAIANGLFDVRFGDVTALDPSLFSSSSQLYLQVELPTPASARCSTAGCAVYTEGALTPRQPIAASPYAFNADTVDGIDGSSLARNDQANTFAGNQTVSGDLTASNLKQGSNSVCDVSNNCSYAADANTVKIGGNSTGSTLSVGTNDANALHLETYGVDRIKVMSDGEVKVGNEAPVSGSTAAKLGIYNDDAYKVGLHVQGATAQLYDILVVRPYYGSNISLRVTNAGTSIFQPNDGVDALQVKSSTGTNLFKIDGSNKITIGDSTAGFGAIRSTTYTWNPPSTANGSTSKVEYNIGKSGVVVLGAQIPEAPSCGSFGCAYTYGDRFDVGGGAYTHQGVNTKIGLKFTNNSGAAFDPPAGTWTIWYLEP